MSLTTVKCLSHKAQAASLESKCSPVNQRIIAPFDCESLYQMFRFVQNVYSVQKNSCQFFSVSFIKLLVVSKNTVKCGAIC